MVWIIGYQVGIFHFSVTLISIVCKRLYCISVHVFSLGLAYCQSATREGEADMRRIINRIWQAASSQCLTDKRNVRVTRVASVFSLFLVSIALLFLFVEIVGSWSGTKKDDPRRSKEFDACLDVSCVVLFVSPGERQRTHSKPQGSFKHKPTLPVSQQASLLLSCTRFKHSPLLRLICSSAGIVDLFVVVVVLFSQRE